MSPKVTLVAVCGSRERARGTLHRHAPGARRVTRAEVGRKVRKRHFDEFRLNDEPDTWVPLAQLLRRATKQCHDDGCRPRHRRLEPRSHPVSTGRIKRLTETFQQLISPRISAGLSKRPAALQSRAVPGSVDRSYARGPLFVQSRSAMVHFIASGPLTRRPSDWSGSRD